MSKTLLMEEARWECGNCNNNFGGLLDTRCGVCMVEWVFCAVTYEDYTDHKTRAATVLNLTGLIYCGVAQRRNGMYSLQDPFSPVFPTVRI